MDTNPVDIARAEQNEFLVENILEHRHDGSKRRTNYEFLVKWAGYDNSDNTWEHWEYDNKQLIKYLYTQSTTIPDQGPERRSNTNNSTRRRKLITSIL